MTTRIAATLLAVAITAAVLLPLALALHGCTLHPLPPATDAQCAAAGYPPHLWVGSREYVCPQDPTRDVGPVPFAARRPMADAGVRR